MFFTDIAASCGRYIRLLTFSITAEIKQPMALLLICGVVIWHRYTLIIQELRLCEQMDSSGLDVCMMCMSRLFVQCDTLSHFRVTPPHPLRLVAMLTHRSRPGVCVPRRLVGCVLLSHWEYWEVHYPWGLAPSQIPSLPGTARPSWREMPAANYTQVDRMHRELCVHICVCLPVTLFFFVTVFITNSKVVARYSVAVFDLKTSA